MLIREANQTDTFGIAKVQVDSWRTTYKGIVPESYIASLTYEDREGRWREFFSEVNNQFAFVAEIGEKNIVGFASGGRNRGDEDIHEGELYAIYLLHEYQRRGMGRLLVKAIVERLLQRGMSSMLVWVLAENPFRAFYEALGGKYVSEKEIVIGGATLIEVAYGWEDLNRLLHKSLNIRE